MPQPPRNWPASALPRLMGLDMAAYYCGVSRNTFLRWVEAEKLPEGKKEGGRVLWDRGALDQALDLMMGVVQHSPVDDEEARQRAELDRRYGHGGA